VTIAAKVGNLIKDPELATGQSGKIYCRFGLAVNPRAKADEPKPEPQFYEVTCFDSLAEHVADTLHKGDRVLVVGQGEVQRWGEDDKQVTKKILAEGVGPDLRFAICAITKVTRKTSEVHEAGLPEDEPF